jgi:hypothetical protein
LKPLGYTSRESTVGYSDSKVDSGLDKAEQAEVFAIAVTFLEKAAASVDRRECK